MARSRKVDALLRPTSNRGKVHVPGSDSLGHESSGVELLLFSLAGLGRETAPEAEVRPPLGRKWGATGEDAHKLCLHFSQPPMPNTAHRDAAGNMYLSGISR
jgi:hypothetical protein